MIAQVIIDVRDQDVEDHAPIEGVSVGLSLCAVLREGVDAGRWRVRWVEPSDDAFPGLNQELAVWDVQLGDDSAIVLTADQAASLRYLLQLGPPAQPNTAVGTLLIFSGNDVVAEKQVVQAGNA